MIPSLLLEHEVHMRRPPWVAPEELEQLPDWPVVRDWVADGRDSVEPEPALVVGHEYCAPVRSVALRVLDVVVAGRVGLPDIHLDAGDGPALRVSYGAGDHARLSLGVLRNRASRVDDFGLVGMKGSEDRVLDTTRRLRGIDGVHEEGEAQDVR